MRFKINNNFLVAIFLLSVLLMSTVSSQEKRRKVRKKLSENGESVTAIPSSATAIPSTATTPTTTTPPTSPEPQTQPQQQLPPEELEIKPSQEIKPSIEFLDPSNATTERNGRGFLDEYYSKFENRVQSSVVDKAEVMERMDLGSQSGNMVNMYDLPDTSNLEGLDEDQAIVQLPAEHRSMTPGEFRNYPSDLGSKTMQKSPLSLLASQILPEAGEGRYMQQVSLPQQRPGEKAYMFSAMPVNSIEPAAATTGKAKRKSMTAGLLPPSDKYDMKGIESLLSGPPSDKGYSVSGSSFDSVAYDPTPADTRDPMSKFFGLTGTTSHDIQLGLTFTVPFMSIPLNAINSMFNGEGLSDMMNFNFGTTTIIGIAILGVIIIFVLPQIIYWLTGVNLSAFSWGRSDEDDHGIKLTSLAHTVDEALLRYDIDVRNCLERTMCNEYQKRADDSRTVSRLSRGLMENLADNEFVKKYVGESRISEALKHGSNGKKCSDFYSKDICPWDTSAMVKIASKVLTSGNIDFASIATAAAAAAATTATATGGVK